MSDGLVSVTPDSVINPESWYSYSILLDGKNIFTCNEKNNALFHLKDLAEAKYLPFFRKQFPEREVFLDPNEGQTKFRILRKTAGLFRRESVVQCCELTIECVPGIRRVKTDFKKESV